MDGKSRYKPGIYRGLGEYVILTSAHTINGRKVVECFVPTYSHPKGGPVTYTVQAHFAEYEAASFRRYYRSVPVSRIPPGWLHPLLGMARYLRGVSEVMPLLILDLEARITEVSSDRTARL